MLLTRLEYEEYVVMAIVGFTISSHWSIKSENGGVLNHMNWQRSTPKAAVDDKAKNNPMHEMEFRKANAFSNQSAAPGTKGKVIALNVLCISFPGYDSTLSYVFLICIIAVCINRVNMKGCEQGPQFIQVPVFTRTKTIGQRIASTMIYCPPQPILL